MLQKRKRIWALWLCVILLCQLTPALAEKKQQKKESVQPFTASQTAYTEDGVTVTGERAVVDFAWLRSINKHSVAWLYQEETAVSQPVLQNPSEGYYRNRGFDESLVGKKGLAHIAHTASAGLGEPKLMIYGSGREDGSLDLLTGYRSQAWLAEHPSLRILTPSGDWQADVFACVKTVERNIAKWCDQQPAESFEAWISRVIKGSEIVADEKNIPQEGQRMAIFVAQGANEKCDLIFSVLRPIRYETQKDVNLHKIGMDRRPTDSKLAAVDAFGLKWVYAQNDQLWGQMRYESAMTNKFRRFNGGGCGPTAAAMVIANLVEPEKLPQIREYTTNGLGALFCSCSVNRVYCNHLHPPYQLETAEEYLRYLPVILADFAAANNVWGINSRPVTSTGSNMRFFEALCEVYGLTSEFIPDVYDAMMKMRQRGNQGLILCVALRGGLFTNTSHYVVIAGVDDGYFYVLDPLFRTDYSKQYHSSAVEEILTPGVVKIKLENLRACSLNVVGYVEKKAE